MKKKRILAIGLVAAMALSLTACGSSSTSDSTGSAVNVKPSAPA